MVKAQVGRDFRTLGLVSFWGLKPAAGHYRAIGNPSTDCQLIQLPGAVAQEALLT
jgi:hypothetical protein